MAPVLRLEDDEEVPFDLEPLGDAPRRLLVIVEA
jgi:hypothetical protein